MNHDIEQSEVDYAEYKAWRSRNPASNDRQAYFEGLRQGAMRTKRAVMGSDMTALAECHYPEEGLHGVIFLALDAPLPAGTHARDVFHEGDEAPADKTLACVVFANGAAIEKTIDVLLDLKADYWPTGAKVE